VQVACGHDGSTAAVSHRPAGEAPRFKHRGAGNAYPLPPGWSHGEEVTVIGFDHGYVRVLGDGKETTVFIVNIDSGWDEQFAPGKWREQGNGS